MPKYRKEGDGGFQAGNNWASRGQLRAFLILLFLIYLIATREGLHALRLRASADIDI